MNTKYVGCFLVLFLFGCGGIQVGGQWPPIGGEVGAAPYLDFSFKESSQCSLNRWYFAINPRAQQATVTISKRINDGAGSTHRENFQVAVAANSRRDIGYEEIDSQNCFDQDFTYVGYQSSSAQAAKSQSSALIDSVVAEKNRLSKQGGATGKRLFMMFAPFSPESMERRPDVRFHKDAQPKLLFTEAKRLQCSMECSGTTPSPQCLRNFVSDPEKVDAVRDRVMKSPDNTQIGAGELIRLLGQASDACNRSEIKFSKGMAYNVGSKCQYELRMKDDDKLPTAVLSVPPSLKASRNAGVDSASAVLNFPDASTMPVLAFNSPDLESSWGGRVMRIETDSKGVYYNTTGGCVAMMIRGAK